MYRSKARLTHRLLVFLWLSASLSACHAPPATYQQSFLQFGTLIDITLVSDNSARANKTFDQIEALLKARHHQWHGWHDGELMRFNKALAKTVKTGRSIAIPSVLRELITASKHYYALSDGLFNPALGRLIAAWGFHQSPTPDYALIKRLQTNPPGMDDLIIEQGRARSRNANLQLDFGAIAKGLAVRQMAALIRHNRIDDFIINAGGDVFAAGRDIDPGWRIAIENPFFAAHNSARTIGKIIVHAPVSIFTSGNYRRFYRDKNGIRRNHIINPKSGEPSRHISLVTIVTKDPVLADAAATTLMLTPPSALAKMTTRFGIDEYLVITEQHQAYLSRRMNARIEWRPDISLQKHIITESAAESRDK